MRAREDLLPEVSNMVAAYDYLTFTLTRGGLAWADFAAHIRDKGAKALASADVELIGLFAPQLGFASNEAVLLLRRPTASAPLPDLETPHIASCRHDRLVPTVRPHDNDTLKPGGIYVHRWFTIDGDRVSDFIDLSNRAWGGFEGSYETEIFGLFHAEPDASDRAAGAARLLLLTWYKNHAVWEASREQAHDTKSLFAQRHQLTRSTVGRSSLVVT
jgi:hypothetical protein